MTCREKTGTVAGWRLHLTANETPCPACEYAHDTAQRKKQARASAYKVTIPVTPAYQALTDALRALPGPTPCADPTLWTDAWTSDNRSALHMAAELCTGCPVQNPCSAAGTGETAGVWGGHIRTRGAA